MVVGILGGGQLARMLALAGHPMGIRTLVLDPADDACAAPVASHLHGAFDDEALLDRLAEACDVVTYEFENVPLESLRYLSRKVPVYPPVSALEATQDRLNEKNLFRELGIDTPDFLPVSSQAELESALEKIGLPSVLKTRRMGYDGKGQVVLKEAADVAGAWEQLGGVPAILEAFVPFDREVSGIVVRARDGEIAAWSLTENVHGDGILKLAISKPHDPLKPLALDYATRLLEHLDYVGVLALEFFQLGDRLLAKIKALPPAEMGRLLYLFDELISKIKELPEPTQKPAFELGLLFDRGASTPAIVRVRQRTSDSDVRSDSPRISAHFAIAAPARILLFR